MTYHIRYILLGAAAAAVFYVCFTYAGGKGRKTTEMLFKCAGCGALGGMLGVMFRSLGQGFAPIFQSWITLAVVIFIILPYLHTNPKVNFYWLAFVYGYIAHLVWESNHNRLSR